MNLKIITWDDLCKIINSDKILLIDLREKEKYDKVHIKGAVWEDWEKLEEKVGMHLGRYNDNSIHFVLYCDRGNISILIARDLARRGYSAASVSGGFEQLKKRRKNMALELETF